MKPLPMWRRYARLLGPDPAADVKDELRFHLDAKTDDLIARGWKPDAARREAERQFGDVRSVQQVGTKLGERMEFRKRLREHWIDCLRDVRYTFRQLRRDPGFAFVSILILALAIGSNVVVFSVVNTLLLRPLPFPDSQELTWIGPPPQKCGKSCETYSAIKPAPTRASPDTKLSPAPTICASPVAASLNPPRVSKSSATSSRFSVCNQKWAGYSRCRKPPRDLSRSLCSPIPTGAGSLPPIPPSSARPST